MTSSLLVPAALHNGQDQLPLPLPTPPQTRFSQQVCLMCGGQRSRPTASKPSK